MRLPVPHHLTGEQAALLIELLEDVIDALIDLHTRMRRDYAPWGEPPDDEIPF